MAEIKEKELSNPNTPQEQRMYANLSFPQIIDRARFRGSLRNLYFSAQF